MKHGRAREDPSEELLDTATVDTPVA